MYMASRHVYKLLLSFSFLLSMSIIQSTSSSSIKDQKNIKAFPNHQDTNPTRPLFPPLLVRHWPIANTMQAPNNNWTYHSIAGAYALGILPHGYYYMKMMQATNWKTSNLKYVYLGPLGSNHTLRTGYRLLSQINTILMKQSPREFKLPARQNLHRDMEQALPRSGRTS